MNQLPSSPRLTPYPLNAQDQSLRAQLAIHAPEQIPEWFVHVEPPRNVPAKPDLYALDPVHQDDVRTWLDADVDLPPELEWFGKKWMAHRDAQLAWTAENTRQRFAQWRWAYADLIIAARPKP